MRHVFVSYCREDAEVAHTLEEKIRQNGLASWRDAAVRAGEDWRAEIDAGIREALAAIVILSPASIRSAYVNYEWAFARGCGIPVISLLLKAPDGELDPRLKALKCLDFTDPAALPWDALVQALRDLEDALRPTTVHAPRDTPPAIQQAVRDLDSMDEGRRRDAIASLGQTDHASVVEILAEAVRHPLRQVRIDAAVQLGTRRDPRAIPALLEAVQTRNCEASVLGNVCEQIGDAAVPALIAAMKEDGPYVRLEVYWSLGRIGSPPAIAALLERVSDPEPSIRSLTGNVLSGHPAAIPAFLELAHDPDREVRYSAVSALTKCAAKTGEYERLLPVFLEALDDEYYQVAIAACGGLEQWGDPRAIPHLLRISLMHPTEQARMIARIALRACGGPPADALREAALNPDAAVRARAISLLGALGSECDVTLFLDGTRHPDSGVRISAARALGGKHAKAAIPELVGLLRDDDREVVWEAALSLGKIGDPSAVPALVECLDDSWWRIPRSAIIALEEIGDASAVPALIECLKNDDHDMAERAESALEKIGTRAARAAVKAWRGPRKQ